MGWLDPTPTPYDPLDWVKRPLPERGRMVCESWATQGYGTPPLIFVFYGLKVVFYVAMWVGFCAFTPGLGDPRDISAWWLHPIAFQKAILWSMLFEVLGLGCGSGPLTGRYSPPIGGFLYFLRPGTTKLAFFPKAALIGGHRRGWLEVLLYAGLVIAVVAALVSATPSLAHFVVIAALVPTLGILDKTLFLAARSEHYWVTILCFIFAGNWIAGAMAVQLALWFFAGFSKLNHHFPTVVAVMTSNGPLTRARWMRERMYRRYPEDLRPSRLAVVMGHMGTALEMGIPILLLFSLDGPMLIVAMILVLMLHSYITSHVPMGVPIEWNVMVVYGAFALFWAHPDVSIMDLGSAPLAAFLVFMLLGLPILGNLFPRAVSFLLSMRYYAGNWAYSVWLFRGDAYRKLDRLKKSSPWIYDQLASRYDHATSVGLVGKVLGFRLMHLHGRALPLLLPKAVDRLEDYEYLDGEIVAGMALGWNFGDGHLHDERLLDAIQAQCGFEEGELRCIFVESQPLGRSTLAYRIADAKSGEIEAGELEISELRSRQPWASTP